MREMFEVYTGWPSDPALVGSFDAQEDAAQEFFELEYGQGLLAFVRRLHQEPHCGGDLSST